MSEQRTGKVALVTGASRRQGIGAAICRALAADGVDIAFTHWSAYDATMEWGADAEGPTALATEIEGLGRRCLALEADLSQVGIADEILDAAGQLGPVSILVNNAAHSTTEPWQELDAATLDAHYAVNVRGMALLSVAFSQRLQGGSGRIINLTSGQSQGPMPSELAYAASKGAVEAFTTSFAAAVAPLGITVNAVNPGPTDTGWMDDELKALLLPRFPLGRIGASDDAARLIAFLASDEAGWITGQIIHSEGGFRRS